MSDPDDAVHVRHILELFQAGSQLPVRAMEQLIAGGDPGERLLRDLLASRAVRDDSWAPLWAVIALGERRSVAAIPDILRCMRASNSLLHEAVEFAMLRFGVQAIEPILEFLGENPALEGRVHLYAVLAHTRAPRAIEYLVNQLRCDEECVASIAWALAETRHPRALEAIRQAVRRHGLHEPELEEALAAAAGDEPLDNPLLDDWRKHWAWEDDEAEGAGEQEDEELATGEDASDLDLAPRYYDLSCPFCASRLEYDAREDDVKVLKPGRAARRNEPCPCGSGRKFERCCGRA
jgi:hypothetical protein